MAKVSEVVAILKKQADLIGKLRSEKADLLAALRLYVRLDDDRRAGCQITADDWAECHQAARAAIEKAS